MTKRAVFLILLAVLCASAALAGPKNQDVYTLNGQVAGGDFEATVDLLEGGGTGTVSLFFHPEPLEDGTWSYYVDIGWPGGSIRGLVSANAIRPIRPWGPVQLNITHSSFIDPEGIGEQNFSSLVGTFTVYTGPGSQNLVVVGTFKQTFTDEDGNQYFMSLKGTMTQQDATFEGTLGTNEGSYLISVEGPNPQAYLSVEVGTIRETSEPPE